MTWLGVPILDWVLLVLVLGLGVEAWITTRDLPPDKPSEWPADRAETAKPGIDPDRPD